MTAGKTMARLLRQQDRAVINIPTSTNQVGTDTHIMAQTTDNSQDRSAKVVANLQEAISKASSDRAWEAIEAFDSPTRAREVLSGKEPAYFNEIAGAAIALGISASSLFEGV